MTRAHVHASAQPPLARPALHPRPSSGVASLLRVQALTNSEAELLIYGPIGEDWWSESVSARQVVEQLGVITATTIRVRINSEGGSVQDGLAIHNALQRHPARVVVTVDGLAASIASLIAMAGDEIVMPINTLMMIHAPWAYAGGNADDLRQAVAMLETYERAMATSYAARSGQSLDAALALLRDYRDHYYTASDAVAAGYADRIDDDHAPLPADAHAARSHVDALVRHLALTAHAPAAINAAARARLLATLTPTRFVALPAARQTALVAAFGDDPMRETFLQIQAQAISPTPTPTPDPVPAPAAPAATPATPAHAAAMLAVVASAPAAGADAPLAGVQARNTQIRAVFAGFRDQPAVRELEATVLADTCIALETAQARLLGLLGTGATPLAGGGHVVVGEEETDRLRTAATNMLLVRAGTLNGREADDARNGNPYLNLSLVGMAEQALIRAGIHTRAMAREEIARRALAQQGTSDFPIILEATLHRMVIAGYNATPFTWSRFCTIGTLSDYRPHDRYHLSSFSDLKEVNEHGEYENGVLGDAIKESIRAKRKGRILQITPEAIVNDDLSALSQPANKLGQAAGRTIEKDVYALLAMNEGAGPLMRDGRTLFHPEHRNVIAAGGPPSVAAFDAIRVMLGSQMDPGGNDYLDITASIWLGSLALGGTARVINSAEFDTDVRDQFEIPNKARNTFRDLVDTPRLNGSPAWYAFADPNIEPVIEVAFLDNVRVPTLEQETNFRTDGLSWKVVHRYGVGAVGSIGAVRNAGVPAANTTTNA
jgi:ATP-dependent protease ClpP protease subunit